MNNRSHLWSFWKEKAESAEKAVLHQKRLLSAQTEHIAILRERILVLERKVSPVEDASDRTIGNTAQLDVFDVPWGLMK